MAKARRKNSTRRRPSKGKTATLWRGPEGFAFVEIVEDIRYEFPTRGKKKTLPWKVVLDVLRKEGYSYNGDAEKLKADYKSAKDYWEHMWALRVSWPEGGQRP